MARDEINAFLGSGTDYQGKLNFQGAVRIDGNFNGEVESEGTLVVGREAKGGRRSACGPACSQWTCDRRSLCQLRRRFYIRLQIFRATWSPPPW